MVPLGRVARTVEGIDPSSAMRARAARRGWCVRAGTTEDLPEGRYDLVSVGMAFHWLDPERALVAMTRASTADAVWLIYNFGLVGHAADRSFDLWYRRWYRERFPNPIRRPTVFRVGRKDPGLVELHYGEGALDVRFTRESLVGYLCTRAGVDVRVNEGCPYEDVEAEIEATLPALRAGPFRYGYTYTIVGRRPSGSVLREGSG